MTSFCPQKDTAADIRKDLNHSDVEGAAGCSPERMVGRTVLFLCPNMKGCCLDEGASKSHSFNDSRLIPKSKRIPTTKSGFLGFSLGELPCFHSVKAPYSSYFCI